MIHSESILLTHWKESLGKEPKLDDFFLTALKSVVLLDGREGEALLFLLFLFFFFFLVFDILKIRSLSVFSFTLSLVEVLFRTEVIPIPGFRAEEDVKQEQLQSWFRWSPQSGWWFQLVGFNLIEQESVSVPWSSDNTEIFMLNSWKCKAGLCGVLSCVCSHQKQCTCPKLMWTQVYF